MILKLVNLTTVPLRLWKTTEPVENSVTGRPILALDFNFQIPQLPVTQVRMLTAKTSPIEAIRTV